MKYARAFVLGGGAPAIMLLTVGLVFIILYGRELMMLFAAYALLAFLLGGIISVLDERDARRKRWSMLPVTRRSPVTQTTDTLKPPPTLFLSRPARHATPALSAGSQRTAELTPMVRRTRVREHRRTNAEHVREHERVLPEDPRIAQTRRHIDGTGPTITDANGVEHDADILAMAIADRYAPGTDALTHFQDFLKRENIEFAFPNMMMVLEFYADELEDRSAAAVRHRRFASLMERDG